MRRTKKLTINLEFIDEIMKFDSMLLQQIGTTFVVFENQVGAMFARWPAF
jgi:hypothetical protein